MTVNNGEVIKAKAFRDGYWSNEASYSAITTINSPQIEGAYYSDDLQSIKISCDPSDAVIYYTLDGSVPDINDLNYTQTIIVPNNTVIKSRAFRDGYWSNIAEYNTLTVVDAPVVLASYNSNDSMQISISCNCLDATVYYSKDGSIPDVSDNKYSDVIIAQNREVLKFRAYRDGYWSEIVEYCVSTEVEIPIIMGAYYSDSLKNISIDCNDNLEIYYSTDGSLPNQNSRKYSGPFVASHGIKIKARAYREGYWSDIAEYLVSTKAEEPYIKEIYLDSESSEIEIISTEANAEIYYTTDGSAPDQSSNKYVDSFNVASGTIVKSIVFNGEYWSDIVCHYGLGSKGPANGYVFYDCDADNYSGNQDNLVSTECGWRYFEAGGHATTSSLGDFFGPTGKIVTSNKIGTGKSNTQKLVSFFEDEICAPVLCNQYEITINGKTYDDWFLPSKDELELVYFNLYKKGIGRYYSSSYWSSTTCDDYSAVCAYFDRGQFVSDGRGYRKSFIVIRSFL